MNTPAPRVGIIGASRDHGWAFRAHVPAIEALTAAGLPGPRITAVATTRPESAEIAAQLTGATGYTSTAELVAAPDVDLVVICVKVPAHDQLIRTALDAGKHVLCEWPLTLDQPRATSLHALTAPDRRGFIGLQGRHDPVIDEMTRLLTDGRLGSVQAVAGTSSRRKPFPIAPASAYTLDLRNGAGNREVHGGHFLDLVDRLVGGITPLAGQTVAHRTSAEVAGEGIVPVTSTDTLIGGFRVGPAGLGTVTVWDGDPDAASAITIQTDEGSVRLTTTPVSDGGAGQPQFSSWAAELVRADRTRVEITPSDPLAGLSLPSAVRHVAAQYLAITADLADGGHRSATFADAVRLHGLLDSMAPGAD